MNNSEIKDQDLVKSILDGNLDDFEAIIERYENKLKRYIMRISKLSNEDAEDILQEIFIKVYTNLASYNPDMSFSAWIYRIARNTTISFYRKNNSKGKDLHVDIDDEILNYISKDDLDIELKLSKEEEERKLNEALNKLSEDEKELILLYYYENKSYTDISDILKMPIGTVSVKLHRIKNKIKRILKEELNLEYE